MDGKDNIKTILEKKIWTIKDVSLFTGFKRSTIYNKVHKDEIPYKKRGGKLYFIGFEIQNWMFEGD